MKTQLISMLAAVSLVSPACAESKIEVKLPAGTPSEEKIVVETLPVEKMFTSRQRPVPSIDTITAGSGTITLPQAETATRYTLSVAGNPDEIIEVYADKGDNLTVNVTKLNPAEYTVTGSPLMEGITEFYSTIAPIEAEAIAIQTGSSNGDLRDVFSRFEEAVKGYIQANTSSPAAVFALMNLSGKNFVDMYDSLGEGAKTSMFYPYASQRVEGQRELARQQAAQDALLNKPAPAFTLPDLDGKSVSIADFKGKWVILDFWGSWCIWCIKGFPALKEAHATYGDRLAIIGIDCRDKQEAWRAAVAKFELPWTQLYNAESETSVDKTYAVQGFPTKMIVNPEGIIVDITTGEDPSFFTRLASLMGK